MNYILPTSLMATVGIITYNQLLSDYILPAPELLKFHFSNKIEDPGFVGQYV